MVEFIVSKIKIRISIFFPAMFVLLIATGDTRIPVMCLVASICHEIGHLIMIVLVGGKPSKIELNFFGISITQNQATQMSYAKARLVAIGGPLVNIVIALFFYFMYIKAPSDELLSIIFVNLSLGIFNLLPIEPLDGGQFIYYYLLEKTDTEKAGKYILIISFLTLVPIATLGFTLLFISGYNFSLIIVSVYLSLLIILKRKGIYNVD